MGYNVAIDGPAGAGKSTIAKLVAKEKGYIYVRAEYPIAVQRLKIAINQAREYVILEIGRAHV